MENEKKWGKALPIAVTVALFLVLVGCTLFGDRMYGWITPEVTVKNVRGIQSESGEIDMIVPRSAVTPENHMYVVTSSQGFSRTIYQIWQYEVEYTDSEYSIEEVVVSTELPKGCMVVTEPEAAKGLEDGTQVLLKR